MTQTCYSKSEQTLFISRVKFALTSHKIPTRRWDKGGRKDLHGCYFTLVVLVSCKQDFTTKFHLLVEFKQLHLLMRFRNPNYLVRIRKQSSLGLKYILFTMQSSPSWMPFLYSPDVIIDCTCLHEHTIPVIAFWSKKNSVLEVEHMETRSPCS